MRNIWEVNSSYLCPMIGVCLSIDEQKSIIYKAIKDCSLSIDKKIGNKRNVTRGYDAEIGRDVRGGESECGDILQIITTKLKKD